jgi:hypothetical protein
LSACAEAWRHGVAGADLAHPGDINAAWTGIHGPIASQDSVHPLVDTIRVNHVVQLEAPAPYQG